VGDTLLKDIVEFLKEHDDVASVTVIDGEMHDQEGLLGVETVAGYTYFVEVKLT
jgi:hypothetical protein